MTTPKKYSLIFNDLSAQQVEPDLMAAAEYADVYAQIEKDLLTGKQPSTPPHLEYVTGLPGAGKSTIVTTMQSDVRYAQYVHVNFDALRIYHPRYAQLVKSDPLNAAARIDEATEKLILWLSAEVAKRSLNVIMDDAAMGAEMTNIILGPFKTAGYAIDATIINVPKVVAQQSVALRFAKDLAAAQRGEPVIPRWVNSEEQNNSPAALVETTATLCTQQLARTVTLQSHDGTQTTFSLVDSQAADNAQQLQKAVYKGMHRNLTPLERNVFQNNATTLVQLTAQIGLTNTKNKRVKTVKPKP